MIWELAYCWKHLYEGRGPFKDLKYFCTVLLKMLSLLIIALSSNSCSSKAFADDPPRMSCQDVVGDADLRRCENAEAICFLSSSGGLSCKFK